MKRITKKSFKKSELDPEIYRVFRDAFKDEKTCIMATQDAMRARKLFIDGESLNFILDMNEYFS